MISYCTNVHPAEDLGGILTQLDRNSVPVREQLGDDRLGVGLWLAAPVARGLAEDPGALTKFRAELDARGLAVCTLNAFPYGGFHDEVVKQAVYHPMWTEPERLRYTLDCVAVLSGLLAEDAEYGSISTLPLAWREPWTQADDVAAEAAFTELARVLREVESTSGRPIKLAVEPEPGCVLDTVTDALAWLTGRVDPQYIGLCLDTCHLAVSFADPLATLTQIADSGLDVVKVQASAALHVADPASADAKAALAAFAEPRYLHQVRELAEDGQVLASDDLPEAAAELPARGPWRVHFHLPLHAAPPEPLANTTDVLTTVLGSVRRRQSTPHIEVETYTWSVLPGGWDDSVDLAGGIAAELRWARAQLNPERSES